MCTIDARSSQYAPRWTMTPLRDVSPNFFCHPTIHNYLSPSTLQAELFHNSALQRQKHSDFAPRFLLDFQRPLSLDRHPQVFYAFVTQVLASLYFDTSSALQVVDSPALSRQAAQAAGQPQIDANQDLLARAQVYDDATAPPS